MHFEYIKKTFSVFGAFHNVLTSFELGFRKPHPSIYHKALDILGLEAEKVFYTDDRPELVESASSMGIRGFVFKTPEQLRKDFAESGIILN